MASQVISKDVQDTSVEASGVQHRQCTVNGYPLCHSQCEVNRQQFELAFSSFPFQSVQGEESLILLAVT